MGGGGVTDAGRLRHTNICVAPICMQMKGALSLCRLRLTLSFSVCVCVLEVYACHGLLPQHEPGPRLQLTFYGI